MGSNERMRNCLIPIGLAVAGCLIILCIVYLPKQVKTKDTQDKTVDSGLLYEPAVNNIEPVIEKQSPSNEETLDSVKTPVVEFIDSEVLQQADEALGEALFDAKYSDPRKFIQLKWYSGMHYKTARRLIKKDKLPLLYEMLEDKSYAPYWHKVALLIGYISEDPNSVPVLLRYFQRDDSWNWKSVDRVTGIPRVEGKVSSLIWIGKIGGDEADIILREAVTEQGALRIANAWIERDLLPNSKSYGNKENVVTLIRGRAAKGLAYSGRPENIDAVKQLYAKEDAYCRTNRKVTRLYNGLVDAMAIQAFITENSRESLLETLGESNHLDIIAPYIMK